MKEKNESVKRRGNESVWNRRVMEDGKVNGDEEKFISGKCI